MKVECYGGDGTIEGDDLETLADRFVVHVRENHERQYPEEALRNYARNYAEAVERLSGSTKRLPGIGEIVVHPVTGEGIDDWLRFFDHDAFAGNPDWASCYCLEPHEAASEDDPERPWRETRARMVERIRAGGTYGYLAHVDGVAAGWVNASLRADYSLYRLVDPHGPDPGAVIGVACYLVAPPFRRHGVASALLDRVIADAPGRGASWVEGYPHNDPDKAEEAHHFRGTRSMYDARGFEPVEVREHLTVVRRHVS